MRGFCNFLRDNNVFFFYVLFGLYNYLWYFIWLIFFFCNDYLFFFLFNRNDLFYHMHFFFFLLNRLFRFFFIKGKILFISSFFIVCRSVFREVNLFRFLLCHLIRLKLYLKHAVHIFRNF